MGLLEKILGPGGPRVQPVHVDRQNFKSEVSRSELPVVLDVWSPSCGPCKMMEPIVMDLASAYQGQVKVAELNVAESGEIAARLGVMGTPTVVFFKRGREIHRVVGFVGSRYLREVVEAELIGAPQP
ncbi:MAG TPA: thioredoxin domain-containing protein [Anaeromyxobacteraceae bacterium]|nr:thioredoxin domain-containing protein [Anaeromyxobacteraceae bacterium]